MRKVIHKWFWVWDFDKEEKWLNEMAAKGLCLVGVGFCRYEFEDCLPGEYNIRLELFKNRPKHPESQAYIGFLEETGAEQVGNFNNWVYFRKKTEDGAFELFSDLDSRIKHLNRIIYTFLPIIILNIFTGIQNIIMFFKEYSSISEYHAIGFINIFLSILFIIGLSRLYRKKKRLQKEKQIYE